MGSSKRADSDLTSVSSGLSTVPDEQAITNGKGSSKASKSKGSKSPKENKPTVKPKSKASTDGSKAKKAATGTKTVASKDSGKPKKDMNKSKSNGKGKEKEKVVPEVEKVERKQKTYGLAPQDMIEYEEDEDIKAE